MRRLSVRRALLAVGVVVLLGGVFWLLRGHLTAPFDSYASCAEAGYPVSQTSPPTCSDGSHTFLGPATPAVSPPPVTESVPFELLVEGDSGGSYPERQEVIATPADWQRYWHDVHAKLPSLPPLLPVDFKTSAVIALSEGQKMTGGYNLKITSINTSSKGTAINVTESIPSVGCVVTESITNRYFIVRTPRLAEPVSFRVTTDHRHCQ